MPDDTPDFGSAAVADVPDFGTDTPDFDSQPKLVRPLTFINPDQPEAPPVMLRAREIPSSAEALRQKFAPEVLQRALQTSPLRLLPAAEQRVITPTAYLTESAARHPESGLLTTSAGLAQGIGAFTDFFSSPEGIAMLGTGNVEPAVQRGIAAAFSGQMISQTPELARQLGDELGKPPEARDKVKIASLVTQGIMNVAGSAVTGKAALSPERIAPEAPERPAGVSTPQPPPETATAPAQPTAPGLVSVGSAFDKAMAGLKQGKDLPDFSKEQPAAPAAPPEEPARAAAVKPSKISPLDLEPALDIGGKPLTGGNTHAEIAQNAVKNDLPEAVDAIDAVADDSKHVFVDKQGNIWTRDQASKALGLTAPLHSERLLELKKQATQPQPDWRVIVQAPKEGVPGFVQIIDPRASEASRSPTVESLSAAGVEVPDLSKLPEGSYSWKEAAEMARKSKMVTLYRAEGGQFKFEDVFKPEQLKRFEHAEKPGDFWTDDPKYADYFKETYGKGATIKTLEIPVEQAEKYKVGEGEYKVPRETKVAKTATVEPVSETEQPVFETKGDPVEQWLERAIKATEHDPTKLMEGVTGAPVWISKTVANGALRAARVVYKATRDIAKAVQAGLNHIVTKSPKNYDEREAREWLEKVFNGGLTTEQRNRLIQWGTTQELRSKFSRVNWERLAELGETESWPETGYISPEGNQIDLSGKNEGGPSGTRSYDHREAGGTAGMQEAIAAGFIRTSVPSDSSNVLLDIAKKPTRYQMDKIREIVEQTGGNVMLDLDEGLGKWREESGYYDYTKRRWSNPYYDADPETVIGDIEAFFQGRKPGVGFGDLLDRAIKKTDIDPTKLMEGVTGAPIWITKALANGALRVVRASYRAGKALKEAIEDGLAWLRSEAGNNFNEDEGRKWLSNAVDAEQAGQPTGAEPTGMEEIRTARDAAGARMADLQRQVSDLGGRRNAPVELKQQLDEALDEHRRLARQLRSSPEYVEDLLKRMEGADPATMDDLAGELAMIEPSLLNRVYADMQKRGVLPPSAKLPEPFSSLQALTDWLKANQIDSPRRPIMERLNLAKRIANAFEDVRDRARNTWARVVAFAQTQAELWKHPPVDDDFRGLIKDWKLADEQSGMETYRWQQELMRQIEDPKRRWAVMAWIQAGGDETLLRYQAESVPVRYEQVFRAALELTPGEKRLANQVRADWAQKLETAKTAGLLDEGRENYGPTVWKVAPKVEDDSSFATGGERKKGTPGNPSAKLDTRDPFFTFHKSYPTFFDGIMAGGVPESMDVAKLVGYYNQAFNKALSSRAVIKAMLDAKAKDGLPLVILSGRADPIGTDGTGNRGYVVDAKYKGREAQTADGRPYQSVDSPALRDWKFLLRTEGGKPILSRADMLVHPDYAPFMKNVLEPSPLRKYTVVRGILKMNRFLKESKFALSPFHMATLGEHALSHTVNPWTGNFKIDLTNDLKQRGLVRGGLDLGFSGERIDFEEGLSSHGGLWSAIPGIGDASVKVTDLIFKDYLPAIKIKMAVEAFDRNVKRYGGELTEKQIYDLTASQANAAFGSQNYRLLGRSPMIRDLLSLTFVAPDFLFSRMKFVGQALKRHGAEQRRALFIQMGVLYVGARVINALVDPDNDPHWGWKDAFSVIYKGRRYTLRTVVQDAWHLATDPRSFWYNRISPITRTIMEMTTKKDWRGINRSSLEQIEDAASWIVPISAEGLVPGATGREQSIGATVGQSFGVMSRKDTSGMEVADLARSFNRRSGDPAAVLWQKKRDQETLPDSDYRKLDRLLEDNDLKDARKELQNLLSTGHRMANIAARYRTFRPFTGSRQRDQQFYDSLSDDNKKLYDRARKEQQEQYKRFTSLLGNAPQTQDTEDVPAFSE